jgi:predicted Fe-Mo cluster-binding NifX family protein
LGSGKSCIDSGSHRNGKEKTMSNPIAMAVDGRSGVESHIDSRFGRAQAFLIVDPRKKCVLDTLENASTESAPCWGVGAAMKLRDRRVRAVLSSRYGTKAKALFDSLDIEMWVAPDGITAEEALDQFVAGTLIRSNEIFV